MHVCVPLRSVIISMYVRMCLKFRDRSTVGKTAAIYSLYVKKFFKGRNNLLNRIKYN